MTATDEAQTAPGSPGDRRGPGRPRSADADRAIVQATLEMLADEGYYALSLEAVAARAGVGKATIYRRWPGKRELVGDALATLNDAMPEMPPSDSPTLERVRALMEHACRKDPQSLPGRIMPRMLSYRTSHPELYADYVQRVLEPRRERLRGVLREGIERGELRADLDVELAALTLTAPLIMLTMAGPAGQAPPPGTVEKLTDIVWPGLATTT